jgi:hypothetical protein
MGRPKLVIDQLSWAQFRETGGIAEPYFEALMSAGEYRRVIEISENDFNNSGDEAPLYLYYRARAWGELGEAGQAEDTLRLAVTVVDPDNTSQLERKLFAERQWPLLIQLYTRLLGEQPDNLLFQQKYIAANYYLGNQDALERQLKQIDLKRFEGLPAAQGFMLYLRIILFNAEESDHLELEKLLSDYPEVFDCRLVLGVSYLLRGQPEIARGFLDGMPELTSRAPRFLRVCALVLGIPNDDLISLSEAEFLLPREQYLLSRFGAESTD